MNLAHKNYEENFTSISHKLPKIKEPGQQPEENGTPKIHAITDSSPEIPTSRNHCGSVPNTLKENNYKSMTVTLQVTPQEYK